MFKLLIFICFAFASGNQLETPKYFFHVNDRVELNCAALGVVKFWYQNDKLITNETYLNVKIIEDNKLVFYNLTLDQAKSNYKCINDKQEFIDFNKHPIVIRVSAGLMQKLVDGIFELHVATQNVDEKCIWIENINDNIHKLNSSDDIKLENKSMTIKNLKENSSGKYGCLVENSYGVFVGYAVLEVKGISSTLWPFFIVCIQCLICCLSVFAYERFQVKKKDDKQYELSQQNFLTGRIATA